MFILKAAISAVDAEKIVVVVIDREVLEDFDVDVEVCWILLVVDGIAMIGFVFQVVVSALSAVGGAEEVVLVVDSEVLEDFDVEVWVLLVLVIDAAIAGKELKIRHNERPS